MVRLYEIAVAFYRVLWLRMRDPRMSMCMLFSLLLVFATAGPLAHSLGICSGQDWRLLSVLKVFVKTNYLR